MVNPGLCPFPAPPTSSAIPAPPPLPQALKSSFLQTQTQTLGVHTLPTHGPARVIRAVGAPLGAGIQGYLEEQGGGRRKAWGRGGLLPRRAPSWAAQPGGVRCSAGLLQSGPGQVQGILCPCGR